MNPREVVASVVDPEIPMLTIEELGILREVTEHAGRVTVTITPTYTGCPALDVIRADIRAALWAAGYVGAEVVTVLHPPWSTDAISEAGRAKLAAAGIAPPPRPSGVAPIGDSQTADSPGTSNHGARPSPVPSGVPSLVASPVPGRVVPGRNVPGRVVPVRLTVRCPRCGSADTEEMSRFGSTACKALWRCRTCAEPFDHMKPF